MLAIEEIIKKGKEVNFGIAFFVEEETTGKGSDEIGRIFRKENKKCLVLEPTSLSIAGKVYSDIEARVIVRGKPSHGSIAFKGVNAIKKACKLIGELENFVKRINQNSRRHGRDSRDRIELNVLKLSGGSELYITPFVKNGAIKIAKSKLREMPMFSWCDANNLRKAGFDVAIFGAGELYRCHTKYERISINEILKAAKVIEEINEIIR